MLVETECQHHKHKGPKAEQTHPIHNNKYISFVEKKKNKVNRISQTITNINKK